MQSDIERGGVRGILPAWIAIAILSFVPGFAFGGTQQLRDSMELLLSNQHDLGGTTIGVAIADARTGQIIFERNADKPLAPASNLKLLTTGTALLTLGADYTFQTRFLLDGNELVIVGSGDPGLGDPRLLHEADPPMLVGDLLGAIAKALKDRGTDTLDGIVVDDRVFDREFACEGWPDDQLNRWYCAEISGLNLYNNVLTFFFEPGASPKEPAEYSVQPGYRSDMSSWLEIANRTNTVSTGKNTLWIARPRPQNKFTLLGDHNAKSNIAVDVAVHEPPMVTGYLLASALRDAEIRVGTSEPGIPAVRYPEDGETFDDAVPVVIVHTSLEDVITRANRDSQNLFTEALIKAIGHRVTGEPGSWANGGAVIRMILAEKLGPEYAEAVVMDDGSGMSRQNRTTAATLAKWMSVVLNDRAARPAMLASMATPGEGTLKSRFKNEELSNTVYAKSGTVSRVRCLSGCVLDRDDPTKGITFSVLVNDINGGRAITAARKLHEEVVAEIDAWLDNERVGTTR